MGGPTPYKPLPKTIVAKFKPGFIYWVNGSQDPSYKPSPELTKILMKRVKTDDLNFREILRSWFMGNLAGEKDFTIKASYKFKNGYIYLTLTSKTGFSDAQMEEAYSTYYYTWEDMSDDLELMILTLIDLNMDSLPFLSLLELLELLVIPPSKNLKHQKRQ